MNANEKRTRTHTHTQCYIVHAVVYCLLACFILYISTPFHSCRALTPPPSKKNDYSNENIFETFLCLFSMNETNKKKSTFRRHLRIEMKRNKWIRIYCSPWTLSSSEVHFLVRCSVKTSENLRYTYWCINKIHRI